MGATTAGDDDENDAQGLAQDTAVFATSSFVDCQVQVKSSQDKSLDLTC